jgi:hypothetical protein
VSEQALCTIVLPVQQEGSGAGDSETDAHTPILQLRRTYVDIVGDTCIRGLMYDLLGCFCYPVLIDDENLGR